MKQIIISPSILNVDKIDLQNELKNIENYGADWVHIDVMDGKFVPNISYSSNDVKEISNMTKLPKDVHIMIENPLKYAKEFLDSGADILTFHIEACTDEKEANMIIDLIHKYGKKAGISIKPNTASSTVMNLIEKLDLVLVMTVEPGKGGQEFMESSLIKIKEIREQANKINKDLIIEVDGGINDKTAHLCVEAGTTAIVSGTYVFGGNDIKNKIESLKNA